MMTLNKTLNKVWYQQSALVRAIMLAAASPIILIFGVLVHECGHAIVAIATGGVFHGISFEGYWRGICNATFDPAYASIVYSAGGMFGMLFYFALASVLKEPILFLGAFAELFYGAYETAMVVSALTISQVLLVIMVLVLFARVCFSALGWSK